MAIYRIAGLFVDMSPRYEHLRSYAEKYLYEGDDVPENVIKIDIPDDFIAEKQKENPHLALSDCEYIWFGASFAYKLLKENGFVLHSSAVAYDGNAYLFSADSGTGKSTHTRFWRKHFGKDNAVIINDDKPAVREIDGVFYASGTPFSGKSSLNNDITVPIKAVCFIHRSEVGEIRRIEPSEALNYIFDQIIRPKREESAILVLDILDKFLRKVPVFSLGVTYSPDSAEYAYREINRLLDSTK